LSTFVLDGRTIRDHFPGVGRYAFHLASGLAERFADDRFRVVVHPRARNTRFDLAKLAAAPNVEMVPVRAAIVSASEQRLAWNRLLARDAAAWHSPFYTVPFASSLPMVVTLADVTPLVLREEMPGSLERAIYRFLNATAARRARAVVTFSDASRGDLERVLRVPPEKITVVPLAADSSFQPASAVAIERVRATSSVPQEYVLYLGTNKPHKNLPRLVQAWTRVTTDATLVIAGYWDPRYPRARELAQLDSRQRIQFRHAVAEEDLPALLSGASAFVFPSMHEGFGLPPLEAMACGAPVVCSNASSLREVVGAAAVTFDPLDVDDIAQALSRVLADRDLRQDLRRRGLDRARQFSWERVARETMRVYESVTTVSTRTARRGSNP
jgi:glycosyltransferase involved in cell wall biosynthesis